MILNIKMVTKNNKLRVEEIKIPDGADIAEYSFISKAVTDLGKRKYYRQSDTERSIKRYFRENENKMQF